MDAPVSPAAAFLAQIGDPHTAPSVALEEQLQSSWEQGRAARPTVELPLLTFVRYLADRRPDPDGVLPFLEAVHAVDLYLACACAHHGPEALAAFDAEYLSRVPAFLTGLSPTSDMVTEVQQLLREKLFVSAGDAPPKIVEYSGRGTLLSWVRMVALRTALTLRRRRTDQPLGTESGDYQALAVNRDPELEYVKVRYQAEFKQAFLAALALLSSEQRNLLRMHFVDGLTIDKLAALFQIHRSTAARWLQSAREAVFTETRRLLQERLQLASAELDSLIRVLHSQLDVSITGLLQADPE